MWAILWFGSGVVAAQAGDDSIVYRVSLERRDHHEAAIEVTFPNLGDQPLEVRMSRTSPGRYALHEFAKNVYDVEAWGADGERLLITRPDLHQWTVRDHGGTVRFRYLLFGDLADGTYSAIDSSHAHLNIPATFVWARGLEQRPAEVFLELPDGWSVATQLHPTAAGGWSAPDLQYFLDSPIEASSHHLVEWELPDRSGSGSQTIQLALHHPDDRATAEVLATLAKAIVAEQVAIFGEPPRFDDARYTFLVDALPWVDGDGMEHRNSTVVTSSGTVEERLAGLVGTISHEFFHAWNVERIRPASLEPFDFEEANVSGELWFAEGFTTYYGRLVLARLGLYDLEAFSASLGRWVNGVLNAPGISRRSPVEMSEQAPFVDDAVSYAPNNRTNTFVSYYTYGALLGLGIDLDLRHRFPDVDLDGLMRAAWLNHGREETPFTNHDLQRLLGELTADPAYAERLFEESIFGRHQLDYEQLLAGVGLRLRPANPGEVWLGARLERGEDAEGKGKRVASVREDSPLFQAGVGRGDLLLELAGQTLTGSSGVTELLEGQKPGDTVELRFEKRGEERTVEVLLTEDPTLEVVTFEAAGEVLTEEVLARRSAWLAPLTRAADHLVRYCPETGQPHPMRYRYCPIHGEELELLPAWSDSEEGHAADD